MVSHSIVQKVRKNFAIRETLVSRLRRGGTGGVTGALSLSSSSLAVSGAVSISSIDFFVGFGRPFVDERADSGGGCGDDTEDDGNGDDWLLDVAGDCEGVAGFVLVGSCGVALGLAGVDGGVVALATAEAVLSATVDLDFVLGFGDEIVCVAVEVVTADDACGDASRLRRTVLLGSLPAIVSWATCCSS